MINNKEHIAKLYDFSARSKVSEDEYVLGKAEKLSLWAFHLAERPKEISERNKKKERDNFKQSLFVDIVISLCLGGN